MFKTIYLEIDEEITSVIDKIKKAKGQDIFLVVPRGASLIQSIINLKLLKKQVDLLGKNVVIVTSDELGRSLASRASFVTAKNLKERSKEVIFKKKEKPKLDIKKFLDEKKLKKPSIKKPVIQKEKQKKEKTASFLTIGKVIDEKKLKQEKAFNETKKILLPSFGIKSFLTFCVISFIVVGIIFFVILPKATILIVPKTEPYTSDQELTIDKNTSVLNFENKIVPGELKIFETKSEKRKFESTGEKNVGEKARGEIILFNKFSSDPQVLVAATRFESQGKIFYSLSNVTIPGARVEGGETIPGQARVLVEAEKPGEEYNLSPSNFIISGLSAEKQKDIFGKSDNSFSGGTSKMVKIISADDFQKAKDILLSETFQKQIKIFANQIPNGKMFIENTVKKEIIEVKSNSEEGAEVDNFEMEVKVRIWVMTFNKKDLKDILFSNLKKDIPQEKFFIDENIDSGLTYEVLNFDSDNGKLILRIHVKKIVAWKLNEEKIKRSIKGKNSEEVKKYLQNDPNVKEVNVLFWPFWVKKVPQIEKKIKISLDTSKIIDTIE